MAKHQICCECNKDRKRCRGFARLLDGNILYCCVECWKALDYATYIKGTTV